MQRVLGIFFFFALLFPLLPSLAYAQEQKVDISVSPVFFDLTTEPGAVIKDKIRIRNNSANQISLRIQIKKLTSSADRTEGILDPKPEDEYIRWISLDGKSLKALPREWSEIPFTITVPKDAAFGYYYAFLISPENYSPQSGAIGLTGGVAIPLLLNIKAPGAKAEGKLLEFKTSSFINEYLPVEFLVTVANEGNVHIKPRGNIFIRRNEKDLAVLEVNPAMGNILPQGVRTFSTNWNDGFLVREPIQEDGKVIMDRKGNPKTKLAINWNKLTDFRFGPYTGHLLIVYDDGTRDVALEGDAEFWVLPYKIIGLGLIGFVIFIFIIRFLLKSYVAREIRKSR